MPEHNLGTKARDLANRYESFRGNEMDVRN